MNGKYTILIYFISPLIFFTWIAEAEELIVDNSDRSQVIKFFFDQYLPSEGFENRHEWTGSIENRNPGQVSERLHQDVIMRINYFRAMAGLNANIKLSEDLNNMAQEAAFMMAHQNTLSHYPDSDWSYYSESGVTAARNSNLSLGTNMAYYGPAAVDGQIEDAGENNKNLGHRRWILYSKAPLLMGHGSVPLNDIIYRPDPESDPESEIKNRNSSMALWVIGKNPRSYTNDIDFIAWPPAGYVPNQVVYNRWSFAIPQTKNNAADFKSANVVVTKGGKNIPITITHRGNRLDGNDPTLAFELSNDRMIQNNGLDQIYSVKISNVIGTENDTYSYEVKTIDPYNLKTIPIKGSEIIYDDTNDFFEIKSVSAADNYEILTRKAIRTNWFEGAEKENTKVQSDSNPMKKIIVDDIKSEGTQSFHLVNSGHNFRTINDIIPSEGSTLKFDTLFRYVGDGTKLSVEIQSDSDQWQTIWQRYGKHGYRVVVGDWDKEWKTNEIPISQYSGQTIQIRFMYQYESGANWTPVPGEDPLEMGAFIDAISISDCEELIPLDSRLIPPNVNKFSLSNLNYGIYSIRVRAEISNKWFDLSSSKIISKVEGLKPEIIIDDFKLIKRRHVEMDVTSKGMKHLFVQRSQDRGMTWESFLDKKLVNDQRTRHQFRFQTDNLKFNIYRVIGNKN